MPKCNTDMLDCDEVGKAVEIVVTESFNKVQTCDFVTYGALNLPNFPVINVGNYGALPLPVSECIFKDVMSKKIPSFSSIEIPNKSFANVLRRTVFETVLQRLGISNMFCCLSRPRAALHIIGPWTTFESQNLQTERSTFDDRKPFATMLIQLPSVFTGGDSVVSYDDMPRIFSTSKQGESLPYIAFYSSCSYTQENITSGYRAVLEFSFFNPCQGPSPGPNIYRSHVARLSFLLEKLFGFGKRNDKPNGRLSGKVLCFPFDDGYNLLHRPRSTVTAMLMNALDYNRVYYNSSPDWILFRAAVTKSAPITPGLIQQGSCSYSMNDFQQLSSNSASDTIIDTKTFVFNPDKHVIFMHHFNDPYRWFVAENTTSRILYKRFVLMLFIA